MVRKRKIGVLLMLAISAMFLSVTPVFASNQASWEWNIVLIATYIQRIGLAGGAISLAINGIMLAAGNEKQAATAKRGIIYTLLAVAGIYLISRFIVLGNSIGKRFQWDPANPSV